MLTAKDNYQFRKTHDARIPFGLSALKQRGLSLPHESHTFGKKNRPQTPVKGIILNSYGETAREDIQEKYKHIKDYKKHHSPVGNKFEVRYTNAQLRHDEFVQTQTSFGRAAFDSKPADSLFKLKRF